MATTDLKIELDRLRRVCDPAIFAFDSTAAIEPLQVAIGQDRAVRAISFGIDMGSPGYHIFALGPGGTGKTTMVMDFLTQKSAGQPVPDDWCYVNNFDNADSPLALNLPAGTGATFQGDIKTLVEELEVAIPQAFESEEFSKQREQIMEDMKKATNDLFTGLEDLAKERGFKVVAMPQGVAFGPLQDDHLMTPDEMEVLDDETRARIDEEVEGLQAKTRSMMRQVRELEKSARQKLQQLEQQVAGFAMEHRFEELEKTYAELENVLSYLKRLHDDVLENLGLFMDHGGGGSPEQAAEADAQIEAARRRYQVNLLTDNTETEGAPVIYEDNPNYHNLIGRVEHEVQHGALVTDFTMIKPGALHRANGGYLVIEARDVLTKPFVWDALKSALKNREIRPGIMAEDQQVYLTRTLQPRPIPLDARVVLIGEPSLYYLLHSLDENFRELFKVKADFADQMDWDEDAPQQYARFISMICENEGLRHFTPSGVAKLVEESARSVADQNKLATRFGDVVDLIRQASYWSQQNGNDLVTGDDVRTALREKRYRDNRIEERLQEMIADGTLLIDTEGGQVGQINGLAVLAMGDYAFGKPSRITARTFAGRGGMVNIEREIELGGRIHNKGVLILSGYLGGTYAQDAPLVLSASITFEQSYEQIDGDSASSAELYALLSSLSGYALRQDLAVTGSVNQRGQVQAIGGVNHKIEGFYEVCKLKGLTGTQGVVIPASNVRHLMLREDVIEAVREGQFHIYAVSTVDEGIELLTGVEAGQRDDDGSYPPDTVHGAVAARLVELAQKAKAAFGGDKPGANANGAGG